MTGCIRVIDRKDATKPTVLLIEARTELGPPVLKVSEVAAVELAAALNKHELTRGAQ